MKRAIICALVATTVGLTGCSTNTQGENTAIGAGTGAVAGGIAGAAISSGAGPIAVGALVGAVLGGIIGHSMDSTDTTKTYSVIDKNRTNQTTTWKNRKTGVTYTMTPTSGFFTVKGNPNCRKYHFTSNKHGKIHSHNGIACHRKDGTWYSV